uniref:Uncharacterized protein n=1 Tax=Alexandrium monilatum TaxID=311494 RepID=A0A7S4QJC7_9DINO
MAPCSSTAAGTTAYLMAAEGKGGSALLKNVARFQGTAGGTIIGQLLYSTVMSCTAIGVTISFSVVTVFEFFAFFLYLSSASYGYVGLLFAAYGAMHLVLDCDSSANSSASVYTTIIDQTMAIIFVSLADLIVQNESAGANAAKTYLSMSKTLIQAISTLFGVDLMVTNVGFGMSEDFSSWFLGGEAMLKNMRRMLGRSTDVKSFSNREPLNTNYAKAMDMGNEAPLEPRFFRTPFNEELFRGTMRGMSNMSTQTIICEHALHDCAKSSGKDPNQTLKAMNDSVLLRESATMIVKRANLVLPVANEILKRENLATLNVDIRRVNKMDFLSMDDQMDGIINEIIKELPHPTDSKVQSSLVDEDYCLVAVSLLMLACIAEDINKVAACCFETPDIELLED